MKKGKIISLIVCFLILLLTSLNFVSAEIIKTNKETYNTKETIFALSTISSTDKLCRSIEDKEIELYIVENKEIWSEGDAIEEVREETLLVPNSKFSSKKIWENAKTGNFDLIIDCNNNKKYNPSTDIVFNTGFSIVAKKGTGRVFDGDKKIGDFTWYYDSEELDLVNEIVQFILSAEDEDIQLKNLSIEFDFNKNLIVKNIEIYVDKNNNAKVDKVDVKIGTKEGIINNKTEVNFDLDYLLNKDVKENFLVVLNMKEETLTEKYSLKIVSVSGEGVSSNKIIKFFGLPFQSSTMEVLDKKTCLGSLTLELNPNPVDKGKPVTAKLSNLNGCNNKKITLQKNACYSPIKQEVGFCILENNICEVNLTASENQKYYACIDKNNDQDYIDIGEFVSVDLVINQEVQTKGELNKSDTKETSEDTLEEITGSVISKSEENIEDATGIETSAEGRVSLSESDAFLVLLEVTLLLILFVLVLILFKLRSPVSVGEEGSFEDEEENKKSWEEKSDYFEEVGEDEEEKVEKNLENKESDNSKGREKK